MFSRPDPTKRISSQLQLFPGRAQKHRKIDTTQTSSNSMHASFEKNFQTSLLVKPKPI